MKKYLMTAVAALAFGGLFTSCTKDDIATGNGKISVLENYEDAFVTRFGVPAADQTWGFGVVDAKTTTDTRAITRQIQPSFKFPTAPGETDYKSVRDPNAVLLTTYMSGNNFYIDSSVSNNGEKLQPNGNDIKLYVVGEVTPTDFYTPAGTTIYLLPNSKLTIPSNRSSFGQNNTNIYIASGAELIVQGNNMEIGYGVKVFNKGTLSASEIVVSNTGVLYNQGTINIPGAISVKNYLSVLVNDGNLTAAALRTEGSGKFQNNANVTITGNTVVDSNDNTWVNNGHYRTNNFIYHAASDQVINNCDLTVDNNFNINLGDNPGNGCFRMDSGSGVVCKNFNGGGNFTDANENYQGGPFYIYMGSGSVFKVTETATMNATKPDYGIYNVSTDGGWAVFQARDILAGQKNQGFEVTYGGKLAVVANTHFVQGNDGQADHPFIAFKNGCSIENIYTGDQKPSFTIASSTCNPGFDPGTGTRTDDGDVRIIAEDLTVSERGDFDFNDVVFDVKWISDNEATITLQAAGGTLPLCIGSEENEVHEKFGVSVNTMVNTRTDLSISKSTVSFNVSGAFNRQAINIPVKVKKNGEWIELQANQGRAPHKIAVKSNFTWCDEREDIEGRYRNFSAWVENPSVSWY